MVNVWICHIFGLLILHMEHERAERLNEVDFQIKNTTIQYRFGLILLDKPY